MGWRTGRGVASGVGGGRSAALSLSVLEPIAGGELVLHHLVSMFVLVESEKQWMTILILVQLEVMVRLKTGTRLW